MWFHHCNFHLIKVVFYHFLKFAIFRSVAYCVRKFIWPALHQLFGTISETTDYDEDKDIEAAIPVNKVEYCSEDGDGQPLHSTPTTECCSWDGDGQQSQLTLTTSNRRQIPKYSIVRGASSPNEQEWSLQANEISCMQEMEVDTSDELGCIWSLQANGISCLQEMEVDTRYNGTFAKEVETEGSTANPKKVSSLNKDHKLAGSQMPMGNHPTAMYYVTYYPTSDEDDCTTSCVQCSEK